MNKFVLMALAGSIATVSAFAQKSQSTKIQGNTEITATTKNMTAVAAGENNVAKNRVGWFRAKSGGIPKLT